MQHNSITRGDEQRSSKRKSIGKRKLSDQGEQRTISQLLSQHSSPSPHQPSSTTFKRSRLSRSSSPSSSHTADSRAPPSKMYNFAGSRSNNDTAFARGVPNSDSSVKSQPFSAATRQSNVAPQTAAKKLVVKNLRTGSRLNQGSYFDKVWPQLDAALTAIFDGRKPDMSLEELYKGAENMCRQDQAKVLAKKLQSRCKEYVTGKLRENLVTRAGGGNDVDTLRAVLDAWSAWHSRLITVRWIFYYLDQSFLLRSKEYPMIREMGLIQFRSYIFADRSLKPKILQGACDLIAADRGAEASILADSTLLRNAIELFHNLEVYTSDFEPLFVAQSRAFVSTWAQQEAAGSLASYVENSHRLIAREVERCGLFSLNRSTRQELSDILDQTLITEQETVLLRQDNVIGLLRAGNKTALKQLYGLLDRRGHGTKLKAAFSRYIVDEGSDIVFDEEKEADMVVRLLQFKEQLDDIWKDAFNRNEDLGHALREAFANFMNLSKKTASNAGTDNAKTGEMIAKYVDRLLKGGWKVPPGRKPDDVALADEDAEINRQLDQVLDLFRFVHGKAVFEAFYKNDLARRLLMGRSASDDAERSMLTRLRTECGSNFTQNLESMFKDMGVAHDDMRAYNSMYREKRDARPPIDLHVNVISAAAWPTYPDVPVQIPPIISDALGSFEKFYNGKHTGRKLHWKHQLAHCQLIARFPKGEKELVVSSFQGIVLLLFNDVPNDETLGYPQIQQATGLSDAELKRTLQSLACARYRVLTKHPKGREVESTDKFSYNAGFADPKLRIKINQIQLKETKEENKTTHERVAADRHYETQAAIVRIMKSRKTIKHSELIAEVIEATRSRGTLQPTEIKTNIEKLIEKDYMERTENNQYNYLA